MPRGDSNPISKTNKNRNSTTDDDTEMIPLLPDSKDADNNGDDKLTNGMGPSVAGPSGDNTGPATSNGGPSNGAEHSEDEDDHVQPPKQIRAEKDGMLRRQMSRQSMTSKKNKEEQLATAVKERNIDKLEAVLTMAPPDELPSDLWSSMITARWMEGVKSLIKVVPSSLTKCNKEGRSPLHLAIMAAWSAGVEEMVARGADITAMTREGRSVLRLAGDVRSKEILTCLLEKAKEKDVMEQLNEPAADKMRPTYCFAKRGWLEGVQEMLKHWDEAITEKNADDRTILHYAVEAYDAKKIDEACAKEKDEGKRKKIRDDMKKNHLDFLEVLLDKAVEVRRNQMKRKHDSLILAEVAGRSADTDEWTEHGPVNARDHLCFLPLHLAVKKGWTEGVDALLKAGAYINPKTTEGKTAIHLAVEVKNKAILDALLKEAATYTKEDIVNVKTRQKLTALHLAVSNSWPEGVRKILEAGADIRAKTDKGKMAIHLAANQTTTAVLEGLLKYLKVKNTLTENINVIDENGQSPLFLAVFSREKDNIKLLLDHGADVGMSVKSKNIKLRQETNDSRTILHCVADLGEPDIMQILFDHDKESKKLDAIKDVTSAGRTALHIAASKGSARCVEILLTQDVQIFATTIEESIKGLEKTEVTALHLAVAKGNQEVVKAFTKYFKSLEEANTELVFEKLAIVKQMESLVQSQDVVNKDVLNMLQENLEFLNEKIDHANETKLENDTSKVTDDRMLEAEKKLAKNRNMHEGFGIENGKKMTRLEDDLKSKYKNQKSYDEKLKKLMAKLLASEDVLESKPSSVAGGTKCSSISTTENNNNGMLKLLDDKFKHLVIMKKAVMRKCAQLVGTKEDLCTQLRSKKCKQLWELKSSSRDRYCGMLMELLKKADATPKNKEHAKLIDDVAKSLSNRGSLLRSKLKLLIDEALTLPGDDALKVPLWKMKRLLDDKTKKELLKVDTLEARVVNIEGLFTNNDNAEPEDDVNRLKHLKELNKIDSGLARSICSFWLLQPTRTNQENIIATQIGTDTFEKTLKNNLRDICDIVGKKIQSILEEETLKGLFKLPELGDYLKKPGNPAYKPDETILTATKLLQDLENVQKDPNPALEKSIHELWLDTPMKSSEKYSQKFREIRENIVIEIDQILDKVKTELEEEAVSDISVMREDLLENAIDLTPRDVIEFLTKLEVLVGSVDPGLSKPFQETRQVLYVDTITEEFKESLRKKLSLLCDNNLEVNINESVAHEELIKMFKSNCLEEKVDKILKRLEEEKDDVIQTQDGEKKAIFRSTSLDEAKKSGVKTNAKGSSGEKKGRSLERSGKPDEKKTRYWLNKIISLISEEAVKFELKKLLEFNDNDNVGTTMKKLLTEIDKVVHYESLKLSIDQLSLETIKKRFIDKKSTDFENNTIQLHENVLALVKERIEIPSEPDVQVDSSLLIDMGKAQIFKFECDAITAEYKTADECTKSCSITTINKKLSLINHQPPDGFTPLQIACKQRVKSDCIRPLIESGADLSMTCKENGKERTTMDLLICRIPGAVELLGDIFNSTIDMKKHYCQVDYKILLPDIDEDEEGKTNQNNMKVVDSLVQTGDKFEQQKLLEHALITSFLHLQWRKISVLYYLLLIIYLIFLLFLNVLVINRYFYSNHGVLNSTITTPYSNDTNDTNNLNDTNGTNVASPNSIDIIMRALTSVMLFILLISEVIYIIRIRLQRNRIEFCMKILCYLLTFLVIVWTGCHSQIAAFAVLLAWFEVIFIVSRIPSYGYYMLMFLEVGTTYFKFIASFAFLIVGFAITFMITFKDHKSFNSTTNSLTKTVVMMSNEFEYESIFGIFPVDDMWTVSFAQFVFLLFIFIVGIVLTNLLIAKAVTDTPRIGRLRARANFISMHEKMFSSRYFPTCCQNFSAGMFKKCAKSWKSCVCHLGNIPCININFFETWEMNSKVVLKLHIPLNEMKEHAIPFGVKLTNAILKQGDENKKIFIAKCKEENEEKAQAELRKVKKEAEKKEGKQKGKKGKKEEIGQGDI